mgnify:CR=1 FL=1
MTIRNIRFMAGVPGGRTAEATQGRTNPSTGVHGRRGLGPDGRRSRRRPPGLTRLDGESAQT